MAGQVLTGGNKLISSNGKFALSFFQTGSSKSSDNTTLPNWYLGIWFNNIPKFTTVWVANRDKPITDPIFKQSELRVSRDGILVILNKVAKSMIWSSQIENRPKTSRNNSVVLLDNGNLVIRDASNPSNVWWQSFDHPTDVFLPEAKIGRNKITGQKYSFTSKKNSEDPALGLYCMELDPSGSRQYYDKLCNSSTVYFSTGEWNGRYFNSVPEMSSNVLFDSQFIDNDEEEYFTYTPFDKTVITICLIDVSGLTKQLLWVEELQDWETVFIKPKASCDVSSVCGPYTICNDNALTLCNCMKGFSVKSPRDWELDDRREGCTRNIPLGCSSNKSTTGLTDKFFPVPSVRLPYDAQSISMETVASAHECMQFLSLPPAIDDLDQKECATKNFSEKLGGGGFGSVFKGILSNSTTIAVKMLDGARQGEKQFRAEQWYNSELEYKVRLGMAKLLARDFSRVLTTMRGTIGYLAPEWISGLAITQKVDVYSYGMVLLEIISGRRNTLNECKSSGDQTVYFPVQAARNLLKGDVRSLLDHQLKGDINMEEVERACKVACWCIQDEDFNRPTMGDVVQVLEGLVEPDMPQVTRLLESILGDVQEFKFDQISGISTE
uniref:non-specific serine/threonine protein kinase n=1 Tax=Oryza sativa subsp. japonica TaxID=39947 RepID=Q5JQY6_ORYSJ|nr:OSJNBa0089E12.21 [Oryza sativa Japonica Group]